MLPFFMNRTIFLQPFLIEKETFAQLWVVWILPVSIYILIIQCCEIVCRPHYQLKNIHKRFQFEIIPLSFKDFTVLFEKITPFGKYEFKHDIHKRQIAESEISPVTNEIPLGNTPIEEIPKVPEEETSDIKENDLTPKVIITSVITPVTKANDEKQSTAEVLISEEVIPKSEEVPPIDPPLDPIIEITPKPVEIPPPPEPKPVKNVVISTPVVSTVPPIIPVAVSQNSNGPIIFPVIDKEPDTPLLHTNINRIPLGGLPYPAPVPVPVPEIIAPIPSPPPPPKKEPPVVKEETPNFFIKGSRFVLYFGSMMLQMLTQLVNGRINLNQPLPAVLPEIQ
ncbi:unnamed protein product [Euphydryas editha]|uniref:Uncharacterized protein n=1 Tax=Euphydryas editha TaxID=104508 RepID=A0AAU9TPS2_EUPED|nr:unnamed protein product [Euphydryas editha]